MMMKDDEQKINLLLYARVAVFYHFLLEGFLVGIWSDFNPQFEQDLNVTDATYGSAILFFYVGNVLATHMAALLIRNLGSRKSTLLGAVIFGLSMPLVSLSKTIVLFTLSLFLFGYFEGIMDVSMNSCGVMTELVACKPLLGSYHGSYSIGAVIGNLIGNVLISKTTLISTTIFAIFGGTSVIFSCIAYRAMFSFEQEKGVNSVNDNTNNDTNITSIDCSAAAQYESISSIEDLTTQDTTAMGNKKTFCDYVKHRLSIPPGVEALSIIGFLASFGESSVVSWCNTYYHRNLNSSTFTQGFGFIGFMICMATGRFLCDRLRLFFGRKRIIFVAGILACLGLLLSVSSPSIGRGRDIEISIATIGFSMTGLGLSTIIPTCFSSAGTLPDIHPGSAISVVAFCTYSGSIVSPYILGLISDAFNLRVAFFFDACLLIIITPLSTYIPYENFSMSNQNGISTTPSIKTQLLSASNDNEMFE